MSVCGCVRRFFFETIPLLMQRFRRRAQMEASKSPPPAVGPKFKNTKKTGRTRPAARPYKKLDNELLRKRAEDCRKKINLYSSKIVILQDRLETYDHETDMRKD